ncbi:MAG: BBP7 family outer membrane beta-barrel protein [Pirellulaceae bacterium]
MKMTFRGVTLAALMLSASQTAFADDQNNYDGDGYVTPVAFVGDISSESEDAYFAADAAEATRAMDRRTRRVRTAAAAAPVVRTAAVSHTTHYAPQPAAPVYQQSASVAQVGCLGGCLGSGCGASNCDAPGNYMGCDSAPGCDSGGCDSIGCGTIFGGGCDSPSCGCELFSGGGGYSAPSCGCEMGGGCDSGGCGLGGGCGLRGGGGVAGALGLCSKDGWFRHELLLWFMQDRQSPALIASAAPGVLPTQPGATTLFGGDLNGGLSAGYRGDAGIYLSDNVGVGGRFWILSQNEDSATAGGDGSSRSIGRPFYNTLFNVEDSLLVAFQNNFTGTVTGTSKLDMMAAEAYGRVNLGSTKSCQLDLIGGYSYFSVDDELRVTSTSTQNTGRIRSYSDSFDTENIMHGGQLGFEAVVTNGRWFARSLTKVHMGDMQQKVRIAGSSSDTTPPFASSTANSGLLALGNQGTYEQDEFTFIPEMNFKLGYRFRQHVEMSVGYSFLMFDSLALAGDQVDRNIDPSALNTNGPFGNRPAFTMKDTSLWVQGIDLGLAITF